MSEITKKDMLFNLKRVKAYLPGSIYFALYSLVKAYFDRWQPRAIYVMANLALGDEPDSKRVYDALKLIEEIRDFGGEEK